MTKNTQSVTDNNKQHFVPVVLWFSIASGLMLIGLNFFEMTIVDIVSVFLMIPLSLLIFAIFLITLIWSAVHVCRQKRFKTFKGYVPLIIHVVTIIVVLYVPLQLLALDLDFKTKLEKRTEVIEMIKSGKLECPDPYSRVNYIELSPPYRYLSKGGGRIEVEKGHDDAIYITFFTFVGLPDGYAGFMYRSDDTLPDSGTEDYPTYSKKIKEHWYWIGHP